MIRLAFMGFRHGHIFSLYDAARDNPAFSIVAACEEDTATRSDLVQKGKIKITHSDFGSMLKETACDAVAVGDYYGRRGSIILAALRAGKHVISDKPVCTRLGELDQIEALARQEKRSIGCQFDMRDNGLFRRIRSLIREGAIGAVQTVAFGGQHPLLFGVRPGWYFEEGKHGGTINDIAIHAMDFIPWLTGLRFSEIVAARTWNAGVAQVPQFHDGAQIMLALENGAGVLGDVSYHMPDSMGYALPQYWRVTIFGREGLIETSVTAAGVVLARNGRKEAETLPPFDSDPAGYLRSFAAEIGGESKTLSPSTEDVLMASRVALMTQEAADRKATHILLPGPVR